MKALLIDDERLARNELRRLLAVHPDIEIAGEAVDVEDAVQKIAALKPALLFLDVQMPGADGFSLLERLEPPLPAVIFTTAFCVRRLVALVTPTDRPSSPSSESVDAPPISMLVSALALVRTSRFVPFSEAVTPVVPGGVVGEVAHE